MNAQWGAMSSEITVKGSTAIFRFSGPPTAVDEGRVGNVPRSRGAGETGPRGAARFGEEGARFGSVAARR